MRLFEHHATVQGLETTLAPIAQVHQHAPAAVRLAWYLRQSDQPRSRELAASARDQLTALGAGVAQRDQLLARLDLLDAECQWLESDFVGAKTLLSHALSAFERLDDPLGCADAHALMALIGSSLGDLTERDSALARAVAMATRAGDTLRVDCWQANQALYATTTGQHDQDAQWTQRFTSGRLDAHRAADAFVHGFFGTRAHMQGQFAQALAHLTQAFEAARDTGQLLAAVLAAVNISHAYAVLNDHESAMAWQQRGLDLARPTGWAIVLGPCLRQMGALMQAVERLDTAQALLNEALTVCAPLRHSRNFLSVVSALGDLAQAQGDFRQALQWYAKKIEGATTLQQADQLIDGHLGVARAQFGLGATTLAETHAETALALARLGGASVQQIHALRLRAMVRTQQAQSGPALDSLREAYAVAQQITGYHIPSEMLQELAAAHARCGQFENAYQVATEAASARERVHSRESVNRATLLQIRLETERARAEAEQQRRLAEAEAKRATLLQRTSETLERLGTIGQEITSQLDKAHVFEAIERHVHAILDVSSFTIYLIDADGHGLSSVYAIEDGVRLPMDQVSLTDPEAFSAQCVRERRELLINHTDDALARNHIPGTVVTHSALFAPLTIAERVLGVMTIQSGRRNAYNENDRLIFRTLCAYAAIALDNSVAYTHLRDAKDQLVAHEKLSALGSLVAGVAHEINTPIGNCLLTTSALQDQGREFQAAAAAGALRRSALTDFLATSQDGLALVARGLRTAADLVQSFKQVAVDRATEQRREFDLLRTSLEVVATLQRRVQRAGHHLQIDIEQGLVLDGYPGPYGQVLTNFINNALLHAFEGRSGGIMRLTARLTPPSSVEIEFSDDGSGIAQAHLGRILDPFFTTKLGQGGSGLGMSISYNIITSLFGGELTVRSTPGQGSCFTLRLPLVAPTHDGVNPHQHDLIKPAPDKRAGSAPP